MDIFVLVVAAIFCFVIAILFRSNEAINRVRDVEKELGVLEDEVKEVEEKAHRVASQPTSVHMNTSTESAPHGDIQDMRTPFPADSALHKE